LTARSWSFLGKSAVSMIGVATGPLVKVSGAPGVLPRTLPSPEPPNEKLNQLESSAFFLCWMLEASVSSTVNVRFLAGAYYRVSWPLVRSRSTAVSE